MFQGNFFFNPAPETDEVVSNVFKDPPGAAKWGVGCPFFTLPCQISVKIKCYCNMKGQALAVKQLTFAQQVYSKYWVDLEIGRMTPLAKQVS